MLAHANGLFYSLFWIYDAAKLLYHRLSENSALLYSLPFQSSRTKRFYQYILALHGICVTYDSLTSYMLEKEVIEGHIVV